MVEVAIRRTYGNRVRSKGVCGDAGERQLSPALSAIIAPREPNEIWPRMRRAPRSCAWVICLLREEKAEIGSLRVSVPENPLIVSLPKPELKAKVSALPLPAWMVSLAR